MLKKVLSIPKKIGTFIGSIFQELKLMDWLSFKNVVRSTILVVAITATITIFIVIVDAGFSNVRNLLLSSGLA